MLHIPLSLGMRPEIFVQERGLFGQAVMDGKCSMNQLQSHSTIVMTHSRFALVYIGHTLIIMLIIINCVSLDRKKYSYKAAENIRIAVCIFIYSLFNDGVRNCERNSDEWLAHNAHEMGKA
jgi:hypothetical protein